MGIEWESAQPLLRLTLWMTCSCKKKTIFSVCESPITRNLHGHRWSLHHRSKSQSGRRRKPTDSPDWSDSTGLRCPCKRVPPCLFSQVSTSPLLEISVCTVAASLLNFITSIPTIQMAQVQDNGVKFLPGQVIVRAKPLFYCIHADASRGFCAACFKSPNQIWPNQERPPALKSCGGCRQFRYCSRECQIFDWKKFHKFECKIYAAHADKLQEDDFRMALRLALVLANRPEDFTRKFKLMDGEERSFQDMESHSSEMMQDLKRVLPIGATLALLQSLGVPINVRNVIISISRIAINSFLIKDTYFDAIGDAVYIEASIFDHSCEPNASYVFDGPKMQVRAIKSIHFNETVYINYVVCEQSRSARQALLLDNYYFTCECTRCAREEREGEDTSILREIASINSQYADLASRASRHTLEVTLNKCFRLLMEKVRLYQKIFGQFHPVITSEMVKCLKLRSHVNHRDRSEDFASFIDKTLQAFSVTHGKDHYLWNSVENLAIHDFASVIVDTFQTAATLRSGQRGRLIKRREKRRIFKYWELFRLNWGSVLNRATENKYTRALIFFPLFQELMTQLCILDRPGVNVDRSLCIHFLPTSSLCLLSLCHSNLLVCARLITCWLFSIPVITGWIGSRWAIISLGTRSSTLSSTYTALVMDDIQIQRGMLTRNKNWTAGSSHLSLRWESDT